MRAAAQLLATWMLPASWLDLCLAERVDGPAHRQLDRRTQAAFAV